MGRSKSPAARERRHQAGIAAAAAYRMRMAELRQDGARCGICRHRRDGRQMICLLHSEGGGVLSPTTPNNLCTDFARTIDGGQP